MNTILAIAIQLALLLASLTILAFLRFPSLVNVFIVFVFQLPLGNWIATSITGVNVYQRYFNKKRK